MSIEDLQSDLERNLADLDTRTFASFDDVKAYFKDTVLPLFANVTSEIEEIDNDVADMVQQSEDILQPETAGLFAMVIAGAIQLAGALEKRLKNNDNDNKWRAKIQQLLHICKTANQTLTEITVQPEQPEEEGESADLQEDDVVERALTSVPASAENGDANVNG